jgi:hypothetical protein
MLLLSMAFSSLIRALDLAMHDMAPPGRFHRQERLNCLSELEKCIEPGATRRDFCKLRAVGEKTENSGAKNRLGMPDWIENHHKVLKNLSIKYMDLSI